MSIANPKNGLQIRVSKESWQKVKIYAAQNIKTMQDILDEAVAEYFE